MDWEVPLDALHIFLELLFQEEKERARERGVEYTILGNEIQHALGNNPCCINVVPCLGHLVSQVFFFFSLSFFSLLTKIPVK
jgi:hypothetical protein